MTKPAIEKTSPAAEPRPEDRSCLRLCAGAPRCLGLTETIEFTPDAKTFGHDAEAALERVARWLQASPDIREIEVRGYAEDVAGRRELVVASARASSVSRWLLAHGIAPSRVVPRGFANAPHEQSHVENGVEFVVIDPDQSGCCSADCV